MIFSSCTSEETEEKEEEIDYEEEYYEFQEISFKNYDIPAVIALPDETANIGASTKPEVLHVESFKWEVNVGKNFSLHLEDFGNDKNLVKTKKKELERQEVFKITYLVDEDDLIMYEQVLDVKGSSQAVSTVGVEHKSYHAYGEKKIDGINYALYSRQEGFEKPYIEFITKSIRSFRAIKD